jgi:hypothetical protein
MLFYAVLFVSSLLVVSVTLWLFRKMAVFSERVFSRGMPNTKQVSTAHLNEQRYGRNLKGASKGWGRKRPAMPANPVRRHPVKADKPATWERYDNDHQVPGHHSRPAMLNEPNLNGYLARKAFQDQAAGNWKPNAGLATRDDRSGLSGRAYQPSEQAISTFALNARND